MERQEIEKFGCAWHPALNKGRIHLRLRDGTEVPLPVESAAEVAALMAILNERPVYLNEDGSVSAGWLPVGP